MSHFLKTLLFLSLFSAIIFSPTITQALTAPAPVINVFASKGQAPFTVLFNAQASQGNIVRYEWNFSDSNADYPLTDEGRLVGHRFDIPGTYVVNLIVYYINGDTGTATKTIVVENTLGPSGNTYYISPSATGSGNGLSVSSPWTVAQLVAKSNNEDDIPSGSRILFKRGEREIFDFGALWSIKFLTRNYPYITIGAYGSGNDPIIQADEVSTIDAAVGKGIILSDLNITGRLFIRPKFSNAVQFGWVSPGLQATIRNIKSTRIHVWGSKGVVIENAVVTGGSSLQIDGHAEGSIEYLYFNKVDVSGALSHCVYLAGGGNNILIENSKFHGCGLNTDPSKRRDGLTVHGRVNNYIIRHNEIYGNAFAFSIDSAYNSTNPSSEYLTIKEYFRDVIFEENKVYNQINYVSQIRSIQGGIFRNNLFYNNPATIFGIFGPKVDSGAIDEPTTDIEIYNNTFYGNSNPKIYEIGEPLTKSNHNDLIGNITIKNNIVAGNFGTSGKILWDYRTSSSGLFFSHNLYRNDALSTNQFIFNGTNFTINQWLSSGNDLNSQNSDPLFASNFQLQNDSPALNKGALVNARYDFNGALRSDNFLDIGAYENFSILPPPPCQENWTCGSWSVCSSEGVQTRTCQGQNSCSPNKIETQSCTPPVIVVPNPIDLNSGLVAYFSFDAFTGKNTTDSVSGKSAACVNNKNFSCPKSGTGKINKDLIFNGNNSYLHFSNNSQINPTQAMTISVWIKPISWDGGERRILQKAPNDSEPASSQYRLSASNGQLTFAIAGLNTLTIPLPPVNIWSHLVALYDGSSLKLYQNGLLMASNSASGPIPTTNYALFIGTKTNSSPSSDYFNGEIDEVRLYNRALNLSEIQTLAGVPVTSNYSLTKQLAGVWFSLRDAIISIWSWLTGLWFKIF